MADTNQTPAASGAGGNDAAFASVVAAARQMTDKNRPPAPKPEKKAAPPPVEEEAEAEVEEEVEADAGDDADSGADDSAEDLDGAAASKVDTSKALELLMAGNVAEAVKALGGDPAKADTSDRRFRALREKEEKLDRKEKVRLQAHKNAIAELTTLSSKAQADLTSFRRENGFLQATRKAVDEKNWPEVAKGLQALTKLDLATLTQKLASGKVGPTTEDKQIAEERAKLAKEKSDFEATKKAADEAKTATTTKDQALKTLKTKLEGHPFLKVTKGFEKRGEKRLEKAFDLFNQSWNGKTFTKTPIECADELQAELEEETKANGFVPAPKKVKTAPKRGEEPPRRGSSHQDILEINAKTFEDRVAKAQRMSSIGRR